MLRLIRSEPRPAPSEPERTQGEDPLRKLALAAAAGQPDAQRTLLVAVGPALLRAVRGVLGSAPHEVEDTLQEAMVALHLALAGFRGECSVQHFACRIAVHTAMNARRRAGYRRRHTPSLPPAELDTTATPDGSPAAQVAAQRRRDLVRQLLCELPEAQAEALAFHCVLGHTVQETADALGIPLDTVRSRLRNGLAKLRTRISADAQLLDAIEDGV